MRKLLAVAALLLASTAAQAQYTFEYGGRTIRVDPDRGTVHIPGVYDNTKKSKKAKDESDRPGKPKDSATTTTTAPSAAPAAEPAPPPAAVAAPAPAVAPSIQVPMPPPLATTGDQSTPTTAAAP